MDSSRQPEKLGFFGRLFCAHEWKIIKQGHRYSYGTLVGTWYDLQCQKCGNIKKRLL